ncbi:MAG: tRNA adenosine deaminase-associated protein [Propionibacteriales bacterium]|nr:tRNA adenosine deaminase-associated protein [Propionibacteriales bacterium]
MSDVTDAEIDAIDVAVVVYQDEGIWNLAELPLHALDDVDAIARELRRYPGESGALALLAIDEDFVILVRAQGTLVRVLLSDATAAPDWVLARTAIDHLGVHVEVDETDPSPAGDLGILADLGITAAEMGDLLDDEDLEPEDVLAEIAEIVGFGDEFDEYLED